MQEQKSQEHVAAEANQARAIDHPVTRQEPQIDDIARADRGFEAVWPQMKKGAIYLKDR
nr:MetaGeneMark_Unknown Function [uncultured bacterium]